MVVIHLKGDSETLAKEQCLYDTLSTVTCGDLAEALCRLQNTRVRLRFMISAAKALQKEVADDGVKQTFQGPLDAAAHLLDPARVEQDRRKITQREYDEVADQLRGCAIIAFPAEASDASGGRTPVENLCAKLEDDAYEGDLDHVRCVLALLDPGARTEDMLPEGAVQLWWASKELQASDPLGKYSGKNEKTKLVCKLAKVGASAPTKEPPISAETQRDMMTYWHKKQEEQKKLEVDEDISYGNAQWADPRGLKNHFQGTGDVKWNGKLR